MRVVLPALVGRDRADIGGVASYLTALERELRRRGVEVTLLAYGPPGHREPGFEPIVGRERPRGRDLTFALWRRRGRWDFPPGTVVHCQRPDQALAFTSGPWPLVISFHGCHARTVEQRQGGLWARLYRALERRVSSRADLLLFETRRDHEAFTARHPDLASRTRLVPLGVDRERFRPGDRVRAREELGLPADGTAIAYLGRLEPEKNVLSLVRAVEAIPGLRLWIAGRGSEEGMLRREAGERVRFLGFLPGEDVPRYLRAADALALASHHEGLATVALQAWASGRPVIVPPVGDFPELVGPDEGILARGNDPASMERAIRRFLEGRPASGSAREEAERRLRERSARFDWSTVAEATLEAYREAARRRGAGDGS